MESFDERREGEKTEGCNKNGEWRRRQRKQRVPLGRTGDLPRRTAFGVATLELASENQ
jgi:hypothetical protein